MKPYSWDILKAELEAQGLVTMTEDILAKALDALEIAIQKSASLTPGQTDDIAAAILLPPAIRLLKEPLKHVDGKL